MHSDVVIVAHNSGCLLAEAVASGVAQAGAAHVWVMDAESTDGSVDALQAQASGIHLVRVPNAGFAAANNRMLEVTDSPYVLLLNPDASLRPGALEALQATAEADSRAGIVGALLLNPDDTMQVNTFGRFPSLFEALRLLLVRTGRRLLGGLAPSPKVPPHTRPVDWVSGAAMLVRRSAIADVGPMDQGFFMYREDIDWCHRMRDHGWHVLLEPRALVTHHRGKSASSNASIALAYRDSFYRYCDLYGLWGLKLFARIGLFFRRSLGGLSD